MRKERGITLIALVITIIVLLILAGVAIAMLSGENGILRKAAEAKTKTEEAQKEEQSILVDYEIDGYFIEKGYKYKCRYGMITGINIGDKVKSLKDCLPSGYDIKKEDGSEITDTEGAILTTGMQVTKNGEEIARTVIFGNVDCDESIQGADVTKAARIMRKLDNDVKEYSIFAADVNHDGYINEKDTNMLLLYTTKSDTSVLDKQDYYVQKLKEVKVLSDTEIIKKLGISAQNSFEEGEDEEGKYYKLTLNEEYTYKDLRTKIRSTIEGMSVSYCDKDGGKISGNSTEKITSGNFAYITVPYGIEDNLVSNSDEIVIQFN